ncbi:MAG: KpsF/GutQ family sugar-phosphate isomerase [Bacteroidales bacterium]
MFLSDKSVLLSEEEIISAAKEVVIREAQAVQKLTDYINQTFIDVVKLILASKGRVVITGIGKSAIVAQKIVATLNSTGTPSLFMHAAEAIHGDLGIITSSDIVLCLSKSGNTPEIKSIIPLIKEMGNTVIAMVCNSDSYLAQQAHYTILTTIEQEACPNNLAPTSSTTAQLVMGDTLAVVLLKLRGFSSDDFARLHPGGSLGKRLFVKVGDLLTPSSNPSVGLEESIQNTIINISAGRLGATVVLESNSTIAGIITDGDIRRMVERGGSFENLTAADIMSTNPKRVEHNQLAYKAFAIMERYKITSVIVMEEGEYRGLVHIHDIIKEGIV